MRSGIDKIETRTLDWLILAIVLVAWSLLLAIPSPPLGGGSPPHGARAAISLPDFSRCTRLEIWYVPSTYTVFTDNGRYASLMNAEELEELRSHEKGVVEDVGLIAEVAADIARMCAQEGSEDRSSDVAAMAWIVCYEGAKRTASFPLATQGYRMV